MKFETKKANIYPQLSLADKMTGKNLSLPVLESIYISLDKNTLTIKATNLDLGIELTTLVKGENGGSTCVSSKTILSYLNNLKDDEKLIFELKENVLHIHSDFSNVTIKTLPHDDFPVIPKVEVESSFTIKSQDIVSGIKSVVYASSVSTMKPELSSVYVYRNDAEELVFVATDSFRLAEKKIKVKDMDPDTRILIPFKNALEVLRVCEGVEEDILVCFNKNQMSISYGEVYMMSRVVDGVFPDYGQIIPKEFTSEAVALKQDVVNTFKIINVFSDKFNQVNLKLTGKTFSVESKNNEVGESENTIPAAHTGDDVDMNFNYRYIVDCFGSINSDSISFNFTGPGKPLVIKGVSDNSFMYLVMSMNK